ncbi:MAG: hypothetical protein AB1571_03015 [Nanoarchaeota archaeon]
MTSEDVSEKYEIDLYLIKDDKDYIVKCKKTIPGEIKRNLIKRLKYKAEILATNKIGVEMYLKKQV